MGDFSPAICCSKIFEVSIFSKRINQSTETKHLPLYGMCMVINCVCLDLECICLELDFPLLRKVLTIEGSHSHCSRPFQCQLPHPWLQEQSAGLPCCPWVLTFVCQSATRLFLASVRFFDPRCSIISNRPLSSSFSFDPPGTKDSTMLVVTMLSITR